MLLPKQHISIVFIALLFLSCTYNTHIFDKYFEPATSRPIPMLRAHSHNDYQHERPLFDALELGFTSIEVDIHLIDGKLLVAHDKKDVDSNRTLQSLYLEPLHQIITQNDGRVYPEGPQVTLLIDIKSDADSTYEVLRNILAQYKKILTVFSTNNQKNGAIVVIISGNRSLKLMAQENLRYAGYDGRLGDLDSDIPVTLIPIVSDKWSEYFTWKGDGSIPIEEKQKLRNIVEKVHSHGKRIRFWATDVDSSQARHEIWKELLAADVDLINTDYLEELQRFLIENDTQIAQ